MLSDIEDNYPEFPFEQAGFRWNAFDTMPQEALRSVREIIYASEASIAALDPSSLSDVDLWAYAVRVRQDLEAFATASTLLAESPTFGDNKYLDAEAVLAQCVFVFFDAGASDEARHFSGRFETTYPKSLELKRVHGWSILREDPEAAYMSLMDWAAEDVECIFEAAEDFARAGFAPQALQCLDKILQMAEANHPVRLDGELLREALLNNEG